MGKPGGDLGDTCDVDRHDGGGVDGQGGEEADKGREGRHFSNLCRRAHAVLLDTCSVLVGRVETDLTQIHAVLLDTHADSACFAQTGPAQIPAIPLDVCATPVA